MFTTSLTLLGRLGCPSDAQAWGEFVSLYAPLLRSWARPHCDQDADAEDVVQEVLGVVARRITEFAHNARMGAFRAWIKAIAANKLGDYLRTRARQPAPAHLLLELEGPSGELSREWDRQHAHHLAHALIDRIRPDFTPTTFEAFRRVMLLGEATAEAARALGLSANAVLIAKSRVLSRLRAELAVWGGHDFPERAGAADQ